MEAPIACDLSVFDAAQRARHDTLVAQLFAPPVEAWELANGYAFRYSNGAKQWCMAAEFVDLERRCCPFFDFTLTLESATGTLWLRMTGQPGVKELLWQELVQHLPTVTPLAAA